ncbi:MULTISPECIES: DUF4214 domain-containing protein [unclassified Modestobacter]|uniref:DUF4214 domain-containing protein n=1 Tax=unclassified Modestobacter TaxID=2643866 RepID=UPI0022AA416C|nr:MULTISPECIES: DUF4214 domain-containing protein [unclassified Modestobacter]MCZ2852015.1 DUF4214 domain-containing protein [Modestobacter sp. VKM Ac-2982]
MSEAPVAAADAELDADAVVASGDELQGVPVLTVSDPDAGFFESVGVTWRETPAVVDVVVQVRVRSEGGQWGEWTTLESEGVVQTPGTGGADEEVRAGTAPYWTGPATGVEVIVQGAGGAVPEDVRVTMIDPGTSEADSLPSAAPVSQAGAAVAMPPVVTRAQWGANEAIMNWTPKYASTIKAATVHHTADRNDYAAADVPRILRSIQAYHSVTRGWGDIGYNVIVDKFGRIFEGRYGGLSSTVIGAHALSYNSGTFGVSMLGNYDKVDVPQATVDALSAIIAWKFSLYGVDPSGTTVLNSRPLPTIFAHREVGSTVCPGRYGFARLPAIRASVAGGLGQAAFVRALYQDMMNRGPDDVGLGGWTSSLIAGVDRRVVSRGFSNSSEYRMLSITLAYRQVFDRAPDPSGVATWMSAIAGGAVRIDDLRPALMASAEFYLRGGSSDTAFVDNIYRAALDRGASTWEVGYWADVRRRSGPEAVIRSVWGSVEAAKRRVDQVYQYYLGRTAGPAEQTSWLDVIMGSGDEQLREEVVASWEYFARSGLRFP